MRKKNSYAPLRKIGQIKTSCAPTENVFTIFPNDIIQCTGGGASTAERAAVSRTRCSVMLYTASGDRRDESDGPRDCDDGRTRRGSCRDGATAAAGERII